MPHISMPRIPVAAILVLFLSTTLWGMHGHTETVTVVPGQRPDSWNWRFEENSDLKSGKIAVKHLLVLEPGVQIIKSTVKGPEPLLEESHQYANELRPLVVSVLKEHQCTVDDNLLSNASLERDSDLRYAVATLQQQFNALLPQLMQKPKDIRKGRFTLGEGVGKLNPAGDVDALVFIRGSGQITTTSELMLKALAHRSPFRGMIYQVVVVDARSGVVLYYSNGPWVGNPTKETADPTKTVKKLFKKFPETPSTTATEQTMIASNPVPAATPAPTIATRSREENWKLCGTFAQPDVSIDGCTALIQSGHETSENLANAYTTRGYAYFNKGQYDNAIADYDEAIKFKPDYVYAFNNRGTAYYKMGDYDRAIKDFDQAILLKPDYTSAITNRANAYSKKGQTAP